MQLSLLNKQQEVEQEQKLKKIVESALLQKILDE